MPLLKATKTNSKSKAKTFIGKKAPDFKLPMTGNQIFDLKNLKGQKFVLYFYPKDKTPGCTLEAQDFSKLKAQFKKYGALVFGVSRDSLKIHESFKESCQINIDLVEDQDELLCKAYDVIQMKSLYGRKFKGIERSSFVIDEEGVIRSEWRKVKVKDHAQEVLDFIKGLMP